jgi:thermolabile hemolysin
MGTVTPRFQHLVAARSDRGYGECVRYLHSTLLALAFLPLGCSSGNGDETGSTGPPPPAPPPPGNVGPPPPVAATEVSALFVLGDSYSDVGNAAAMADYLLSRTIEPPTIGLCNPADVVAVPRPCADLFFRQSRVSDGAVAVEHLAAHLRVGLAPSFHVIPARPSVGTDYAVASAKARGPAPEDLAHQVDRLVLDHGSLPADAIYVMLIGGNDAIDAFQAAASGSAASPTSDAIVTSAIAAIGTNVERLLDFGARLFVVANVPDLAVLPAVVASATSSANEAALLASATAISNAFDRELRTRLEHIAGSARWSFPTPPALVVFDLRAAVRAAQQAGVANGGNGLDACFDSEIYRQSAAAERVFHPDCAPQGSAPPRFADFVFWDGIHPTGAAHQAVGVALIEAVEDLLSR